MGSEFDDVIVSWTVHRMQHRFLPYSLPIVHFAAARSYLYLLFHGVFFSAFWVIKGVRRITDACTDAEMQKFFPFFLRSSHIILNILFVMNNYVC
ncbi:hypothetical protein V1523DRAFT_406908, partial [Lipomyces doorenjongii]